MKTCLEYMGLNIYKFLIYQNISTDLHGPKKNINCTMDNVRGCFLCFRNVEKLVSNRENNNRSAEFERSVINYWRGDDLTGLTSPLFSAVVS